MKNILAHLFSMIMLVSILNISNVQAQYKEKNYGETPKEISTFWQFSGCL